MKMKLQMKKKLAMLMAAACLVLWGGGMTAHALEYNYCPQCGAGLVETMQHLGDWNNTRVFDEKGGTGKITCHEHYSMDRRIRNCPNGCGLIWAGEPVESSTHSLPNCPYKK